VKQQMHSNLQKRLRSATNPQHLNMSKCCTACSTPSLCSTDVHKKWQRHTA